MSKSLELWASEDRLLQVELNGPFWGQFWGTRMWRDTDSKDLAVRFHRGNKNCTRNE